MKGNEPERLGDVLSFADEQKRRRVELREFLRPTEEVAAWERDLERLQRDGAGAGARLDALVDWPAISSPDAIARDAASAPGLEWARLFKPGDPGAVLWGRAGTGKTTLCCHLLCRLKAERKTCALVAAPRLIDALEADRWHRGELLADVRRADVLVLDDMGSGTWRRGWGGGLGAIVDARWQARRRGNASTILTSNLRPGAMHAFGWVLSDDQDKRDWDRIDSRLRALMGRVIEYGGNDRRGT